MAPAASTGWGPQAGRWRPGGSPRHRTWPGEGLCGRLPCPGLMAPGVVPGPPQRLRATHKCLGDGERARAGGVLWPRATLSGPVRGAIQELVSGALNSSLGKTDGDLLAEGLQTALFHGDHMGTRFSTHEDIRLRGPNNDPARGPPSLQTHVPEPAAGRGHPHS